MQGSFPCVGPAPRLALSCLCRYNTEPMTTPADILDFAVEQEYHTLTPNDFSRALRDRLDALPECGFEGLEESVTYVAKTSGSGYHSRAKYRVLTVQRVTPKGTQAVVRDEIRGTEKRLYKGKESRTRFLENDGRTAQLSQYEHEEIVRHALQNRASIPVKVRRHYPALFIDVPGRFEDQGLTKRLTGMEPATPKRLEEWAARTIDKLDELHTAEIEGRKFAEWTDREISDLRETLDFYDWLWQHVDDGGVFCNRQPVPA